MSGNLAEPGPIMAFAWDPFLQTTNLAYEVMSTIYFPGSKFIGRPKKIRIVAEVDVATSPGDIRIYDFTNGKIIAEKTGITDIVKTIQELAAANVPNKQAIWEIQARVPDLLPNDIIIHSVALLF